MVEKMLEGHIQRGIYDDGEGKKKEVITNGSLWLCLGNGEKKEGLSE